MPTRRAGVQRLGDPRRNVRLTWQASQKHKFNIYFDEQSLKDNHEGGGTATTSPEASGTADAYPQHLVQGGWQSPWTNRLLFDATFSASVYDYGGRERPATTPAISCGSPTPASRAAFHR
jgi:hypothetical protein